MVNAYVAKHTKYLTDVSYVYMLFTGWEVRIVKNWDLGLENAARGRGQHFQDRGHSFFTIRIDPKPANNFFIFPSHFVFFKKDFVNKRTETHVSITVPVGRDRKIWTA